MKRVIKAKVGSKEQAAQEFIEAWHDLETGDKEVSDDRLYFESAETLLKTLTPKRGFPMNAEPSKSKTKSGTALKSRRGSGH